MVREHDSPIAGAVVVAYASMSSSGVIRFLLRLPFKKNWGS